MSKRTCSNNGEQLGRGVRQKLQKLNLRNNNNDEEEEETADPSWIEVEVFVTIDPGTDYTKAAFQIIRTTATLDQPAFVSKPALVAFDNKGNMKSQVSFTKENRAGKYTFRYGCEVDKALKFGQIQETDKINFFKPAFFGEDIGRNQTTREKIAQFPLLIREKILSQRFQFCGQSAEVDEVTDIELLC